MPISIIIRYAAQISHSFDPSEVITPWSHFNAQRLWSRVECTRHQSDRAGVKHSDARLWDHPTAGRRGNGSTAA